MERQLRRSALVRSDTEERILRITAGLLAVVGPEVSVDRICEAVGCSKGAFYYHFPTKRELIIRSLSLARSEHKVTATMAARFLPFARQDIGIARALRRGGRPRSTYTTALLQEAIAWGEAIEGLIRANAAPSSASVAS